ncbi:MAG: phosphonate C-P lyase system protein PhnG [Cyclobacteriaceae bacterium]
MGKQDFILCECQLEPLQNLVAELEPSFETTIIRMPSICMTMIQAEDSVEFQPFYLGEAVTTECEVMVNAQKGYGVCLGDEPLRCYCIAFLDAVTQLKDADQQPILTFLDEQAKLLDKAAQLEHNQILTTKVDFKLMEQD